MCKVFGGMVLVVVGAMLVGCGHHEKQSSRDTDQFFGPECRTRVADQFVMAAAAEGAREDGMLYACHFEGTALNTAGQSKINLMVRNHMEGQKVMVYLDLAANDAMADARKSAVETYLKNSGYAGEMVALSAGDNPMMRTSASTNLHNMHKSDSDYQNGKGEWVNGASHAEGGSSSSSGTSGTNATGYNK